VLDQYRLLPEPFEFSVRLRAFTADAGAASEIAKIALP
jgi:hypothetical protein